MGDIHDLDLGDGSPARATAKKRPEAGSDSSPAITDPGSVAGSVLELQRLAGNAVVSRMLAGGDDQELTAEPPSGVLDVVGRGGGQPLDDSTRSDMESRLGADFGDVRVHTGAAAGESAREVGANAYTVGNDVVFRSEQWAPTTESGKKTLAHELSHVVQQRSGPVEGTSVGGGIRVSDPSDRFERAADQAAEAAMSAGANVPSASSPAAAPTAQRQESSDEEEEESFGAPVQRQTPEEEEEELQGEFVQRQTPEEEEEELQGEFVQRQTPEEEEEELQGEFVQRQTPEEEEEEPVPG
jgi:hypothetical protein